MLRLEAQSSSVILETVCATTHAAEAADAARQDSARERTARVSVQFELDRRDTRSLSTLVEYLAPDGRANALLKKKGFDALVTSGKAVAADSRQREDYCRATALCAEGLITYAAGNDPKREQILTLFVATHLQKCLKREGSLQSLVKDERMLDLVKTNIAVAWRAFKKGRDYASARHVLSLLIAGKGNGMPFASICAFLSDIRPIKIGDCVRALPRGAIRNAWGWDVCVARRCSLVDGEDCGVMYDVAHVVGAGCARRACSFLTDVPANRVHHADSIV